MAKPPEVVASRAGDLTLWSAGGLDTSSSQFRAQFELPNRLMGAQEMRTPYAPYGTLGIPATEMIRRPKPVAGVYPDRKSSSELAEGPTTLVVVPGWVYYRACGGIAK